VLDHRSLIISINSSCNNHPNSNLNIGYVCAFIFSPVFNNKGVWLDISLVNALTVDKGNFSSHLVVIRIRFNFLKVGCAKLFAHVNLRLDISTSLRFNPFITTLKRKCHLAL
jgi:hypothetical protein